jgi:surfeit locus 1 family protein
MTAVGRQRLLTLAAVFTMLLTARLGWWQLDRAAQKQALQASMQHQAELPVLPADRLPAEPRAAQALHHRRIALSGQWLPERTVYLDNRQMGGRPGFFVMTPLRLPAGDAVLVQRGWLPRDMQDRTRLAAYTTSTGAVSLLARMAPPPSRLIQLGDDAPGAIRQNLELEGYAREIDQSLLPLSLIELATAANQGDGLARDWPQPAIDIQKHHGYAAQWFALCALTAGLYVWFQLVRPRRASKT